MVGCFAGITVIPAEHLVLLRLDVGLGFVLSLVPLPLLVVICHITLCLTAEHSLLRLTHLHGPGAPLQ